MGVPCGFKEANQFILRIKAMSLAPTGIIQKEQFKGLGHAGVWGIRLAEDQFVPPC
jgi:hypothetical protein